MASFDNVFGFGRCQANRFDDDTQTIFAAVQDFLWAGKVSEQVTRDGVDRLVCGLSAEHHRDQKFKIIFKDQLRPGIGQTLAEFQVNPVDGFFIQR